MASPWLRPEKADWSHFFFTVNPGHVDIIRQWDMHRGNRNPALCTVQFLVYSDCVWDHFFHVGLTGAALQYRNIHLGLLTSKAESLLAPRTIRWWQRERTEGLPTEGLPSLSRAFFLFAFTRLRCGWHSNNYKHNKTDDWRCVSIRDGLIWYLIDYQSDRHIGSVLCCSVYCTTCQQQPF